MVDIQTVIQEVKETIAILEEQKDNPDFIEAGGLLQIESEKIKLAALAKCMDE